MKKRKIKRDVKTIGVALYWMQVVIAIPVILPLALIGALSDMMCNAWNSYKRWFLSKFRVE